jgi:hypothetical protein
MRGRRERKERSQGSPDRPPRPSGATPFSIQDRLGLDLYEGVLARARALNQLEPCFDLRRKSSSLEGQRADQLANAGLISELSQRCLGGIAIGLGRASNCGEQANRRVERKNATCVLERGQSLLRSLQLTFQPNGYVGRDGWRRGAKRAHT